MCDIKTAKILFNCYELDDSDLVKTIQKCTNDEQIEAALREFANISNLNNK